LQSDPAPNPASKVLRILVWTLAGLVLLVAVIVGATAIVLPGCTACHSARRFVTQTEQSAHAKIECIRCHVQSGAPDRVVYAYRVIFGMTLRVSPPGSGPVAGIPDRTCLSCHKEIMAKVTTSNGLSINHALCSKGRMCTDCHSNTAHGTAVAWPTTADMNLCLGCHSTEAVRSDCNTCHAAKSEQERLRSGEWAVTHGPNWKQTHGMGDLDTCAACHTADYCIRCHGIPLPHGPDFIHEHPAQALNRPEDCTPCHKQAFCTGCHGTEMPHPKTFTPAHSSIVKTQGSVTCMRCHTQVDCDNCHVAHVHPGGAKLPPGGGQ